MWKGKIMGLFDWLFKRNNKKNMEKNIKTEFGVQNGDNVDSSYRILSRGNVVTYKIELDNNINQRFIAFDVETTGLNPSSDRIIELGAVVFENKKIINKFSSLVNPQIKVPSRATAVNHITNKMLKNAPDEKEAFSRLIDFLGDAINGATILCAHNAPFDMKFLSETLMRLGYDGTIYYADSLSISRKLVKGLNNYKQDTVASYFNIVNEESHRAVTDAEVCGKILIQLLEIKQEEQQIIIGKSQNSVPDSEEMEVCAYIQDAIIKNGGDSKLMSFYKNSSRYIDVRYMCNIVKFKFAKKGKYIIVKNEAAANNNYKISECTMSEGGSDYVRCFFNNPFELEPLIPYIYQLYKEARNSALDYNTKYENEYRNSTVMQNTLSENDVVILLESAQNRLSDTPKEKNDKIISNQENEIRIERKDIEIHPVNKRVALSEINNLNNWEKGFDEGYSYWEEGDKLRKDGRIEEAIELFDMARYKGYSAPVLYHSYAMAYHKIKDFENEIDILDEGIKRAKKGDWSDGNLETRRNKAMLAFVKNQEQTKKSIEKKENISIANKTIKKSNTRAILQFTDDMILIKKYESIAQAVRETGVNSKSIRDTAKGIQKHAGGFVWKYCD